MQREQRGFTLIELLIVVAIIGILAAIAIPNLMSAMNRARQKRTMSDIRTLGMAWEQRAVETGSYVAAGFSICCTEAMTVDDVEALLTPVYVRSMVREDAWNNDLEFAVDDPDDVGQYLIRSLGRDGMREDSPDLGPTNDFDCDIIYASGRFVQYPEGVQVQ